MNELRVIRYKGKDGCNIENKGCYFGKEARNMNIIVVLQCSVSLQKISSAI